MANFSSLMGYQYHQKRCGKQLAEADKPVFSCPHCGKKYKSKAGHDYHVRSEHAASVSPLDDSEARGAGPALPGSDCRAAEPVGRTEPGRAGMGKAGADVGLVLFFSFASPRARVVPCSVGGKWATALSDKAGCCVYGHGAVSSVPFLWCSRPPCTRALQGKNPEFRLLPQPQPSAGVAGSVPRELPLLFC